MGLGLEEGKELAFLSQGALCVMREITSYKSNYPRRESLSWRKQERPNILSTVGMVNARGSSVEAVKHRWRGVQW